MLTDQQKQAVQMLFDGMKVQDVAAALGVNRCTVWRWSRKKEFAREWHRVQKAFIRKLRKESGYYERRKEHRRRLRQLEKEMEDAAGRIRNGHTKEFNSAWNKYVSCLFKSE